MIQRSFSGTTTNSVGTVKTVAAVAVGITHVATADGAAIDVLPANTFGAGTVHVAVAAGA